MRAKPTVEVSLLRQPGRPAGPTGGRWFHPSVSAEAIESLSERTLCKSVPQAKQAEWARLSIEQKRERTRHLSKGSRSVRQRRDRRPNPPNLFVDARTLRIDMRIATIMKAGVGGRQIVRAMVYRRELIGLS